MARGGGGGVIVVNLAGILIASNCYVFFTTNEQVFFGFKRFLIL